MVRLETSIHKLENGHAKIPDGFSSRTEYKTRFGLWEYCLVKDTFHSCPIIQPMQKRVRGISNPGLDKNLGVDDEKRSAIYPGKS